MHERTDLTFTSLYGLSQSLAALRTHDLKEGMGITVLTTVNADGAFAGRPMAPKSLWRSEAAPTPTQIPIPTRLVHRAVIHCSN